jgi:amino acid adenylation domain-containing protein
MSELKGALLERAVKHLGACSVCSAEFERLGSAYDVLYQSERALLALPQARDETDGRPAIHLEISPQASRWRDDVMVSAGGFVGRGPAVPPSVVCWFTEQAAVNPGATAVELGERSLTYAELEARANRLAHFLAGRGIGPESPVGLLLPRSLELVVAILGTLKAGAFYVPLDPTDPAERLRFIWRDARAGCAAGAAALLLGDAELAGWLPAAPECGRLVDPARHREEIAAQSAGPPAAAALPDNLAYLIYTSGSTGRPKGVAVAHRALVNTIDVAIKRFGAGPGSRVLQLASIGFDASVLEIWMALATGGTLVLTPRETLLSTEALARELTACEITVMALSPSVLERIEGADFPRLRSVIAGAEACLAATARRWAADRSLWNVYAPTEATIFATAFACTADQGEAPPLGRAIPGMRAHLLNDDLAPVGPGEPGEIFLGGVGVARGYHGRPDLTAERFLPDPSSAHGERLYRTGDMGRVQASGDIEFLGRADQQVKVRGLRVELGEIETVLAGHPAVLSAAVVARPALEESGGAAASGDKRLVAYLVPRSVDATPTASELRTFLARLLPEYMIPAAFVQLGALPLTSTGKLDRKALPVLGRERLGCDEGYVAPAGPLEERLARIWGEVLALDRVGARDNLFELGGHSLIATQIVNRVRAQLGLELPLLDVFAHPTVAGQAESLAIRGAGDAAARATGVSGEWRLPPIARADRGGPLPLSYSQERIWFLNQLAPGAIAYNFQFTVRLRGRLAPQMLERALREAVRRHEILRTSFPAVSGRPVQVIHPVWPEGHVVLPLVDLEALAEHAREPAAEARVQAEIRRSFDVTRLPLVRWLLLRLGPHDHLMVQVEHHFVHDGWSLAVFLREIAELYSAFVRGAPSPLPELPVQYADFALWQRRWLAGGELDKQLAYWQPQLAGAPPLELMADHPRPRGPLSFRGGALRVDLPHELYGAARRFSRRAGATLFMSMLAAFYAVLHRYTGQTDISLGSGIANRRLRESEDLIGMVVNTVVLRTAFDGAGSFARLLVAVRETTLAAHVYQDLPFEKLVEGLQPDRELSRNPLFQVLFSFHDAPVPKLDLAGLVGELLERHNGSAKSDLNVVAMPRAERRAALGPPAAGAELTMMWEYSSDLYDRATIARMWGHYQVLFAGAVVNDAVGLADLPLLNAAEIAQLEAWSRAAPPSLPETLQSAPEDPLRLFARHAARRPEAPALTWEGGEITYGELDSRSRRLAAELRAAGIGPEMVVAICAERSPETVIAALAILRSGAAYLPLDPGSPQEQLEFMLTDAGAAAVLSRRDLRSALPAVASPVIEVDAGARSVGASPRFAVAAAPEEAEESQDPRQLAYVIYTSGSTGRPKGIEIDRAGLANLVRWHLYAYGVHEGDRATLLAGPAFDASVWELWPYLAACASIHIPPWDVRASAERLLGWLAEREIDLCFLPTPLAAALLDEIERRPVPPRLALRALLTGGDRLPRAPARELPFALWNHYGSTENTVVATAALVPAGLAGAPLIGRPIAGTRARVLDPAGGRLPAGVPGELAIGGAGLARGYRGRPELTAEKFVPDPWGEPGDRLYRTGDLARLTATGEIEFLGRRDRQVKIRGFRIELGEIEAVLREHPAVREAVVVARPAAGGDRRLVAYVAAAHEPSAEELSAMLAARLPDYMVPAAFVTLATLPLARNGKVDLAALPEPEPEAEGGRGETPSGALEELLHGIWSALLGRSDFSVHDNFFRLGGHSLLATLVLSRVRDTVQVELPLATLFAAPTVAALAGELAPLLRAPGLGAERAGAAARVSRRPRPAELAPLSFAQERLWFLEQLAPGGSTYNIGRAYALDGTLAPAALARAIGEIARRHEVLRTRFETLDDRPVQVAAPAAPWLLPVADLAALPDVAREAETRRLTDGTVRRSFDLVRGPLLRTLLLRRGPDQHLLVIAMHHIVSDGWSLSLFVGELAELYQAYAGAGGVEDADVGVGPRSAVGAPILPEPPVQYADYAVWQRDRFRGGALAEKLVAWWRQELAGAPPTLDLPTDRPRPPLQSFRGGLRLLQLPAAAEADLRAFGWNHGATPFMVMLGVLTALLSRYSGQSDVVVGSPVAGRNQSEIERLIGFFVNTLVLRSRWSGDPPLGEIVALARRATLAAHAHQELPFEALVAELSLDRLLGQTPLFQVLFNLQNPAPEPRLQGLRLAPVLVPRPESRFDLEIEIADGVAPLCRFRYDSDLYDGATVARMAGHFANLLAALLADPGCRLGSAPLLSAPERHQLLLDWNDTATAPAAVRQPQATAATLGELFAEQAARTPRAVALMAGGEVLTYGELRRRANQLAWRLRAEGIGPEVTVGVLLERTPRLVESLLAILEAGGAYVPLDPAYPARRITYMLEDAAAPLLLTVERLAVGLAPELPAAVRVLNLDVVAPLALAAASPSESTVAAQPPGDAGGQAAAVRPLPPPAVVSQNLAYVIYTSGSTGRPKGVAIEHRSAVALVAWAHRTFSPADLAGVFAATSICFDLSVFELFAPLTAGGSVILGDDVLELASLVPAAAATVSLVNTVPSTMAELLRLGAVPPSVRTINLTGEALSPQLVAEIYAQTGARRVLDLYGPSEDTTYSTCALRRGDGPATIGRPLDDTRVYLLDPRLEPVPAGMPGELCLTGAGLARGYVHSPVLTAERFVPDPFAAPAPSVRAGAGGGMPALVVPASIGRRLYRTGDLARTLPDGRLQFLGRRDQQIKLRGYRIELGEIEAQLARHPMLREVAVAACPDQAGGLRMVAYVVPAAPAVAASPEQLRDWLHLLLPAYMVPAAWVVLPRGLPRTQNGKIDRRALSSGAVGAAGAAAAPTAATGGASHELRPPFEAPLTAEERLLAPIWEEALGLDRIGIHDDFFRLGGQSLLATRVVARLRRELEIDLPLRSLFQAPTLGGLARAIAAQRATEASRQRPDGGSASQKIPARASRVRR